MHRSVTPDTRLVSVAAALLAATALAGCGSSGSGKTTTSLSSSAGGSAGTPVTATETEYKIRLSRTTFAAGIYTFVVKDAGAATHALEINGPGVKDMTTANINHGQSAKLTVTLQKGTYEIWCPVDGHKQLGMDTHITVS